jgi:hypothetical protein
MTMVDEGRKEQIRYKKEQYEQERNEGQKFASKFLNEASEAIHQDREELEKRKQIAIDNKIKLQQQIDYRKYKEEIAKQEAYLQDRQMQHIEKLHKEKLAEQGGVVRDFRPLKKNSWYT